MNHTAHRGISLCLAVQLLMPALPRAAPALSDRAAEPIFLTQSVVQPLFSPIHPLSIHVKAQLAVLWTGLMPYVQSVLAYIPAILSMVSAPSIETLPLFAMALPPDQFSRHMIDLLMEVALGWPHNQERDPWTTSSALLRLFIEAPELSPERVENEQFRTMLRERHDVDSLIVSAMLDMQLVAAGYPDVQNVRSALETLKSLNAANELLSVADKSDDFITVAGALDTLEEMDAQQTARTFRRGRLVQLAEKYRSASFDERSRINVIPVLARAVGEQLDALVEIPELQSFAQKRFQLGGAATARTALRLLAGLYVEHDQVRALLDELKVAKPDDGDMNMQMTLRMLAIMQYMALYLPPQFAAGVPRAEQELVRIGRIRGLYLEITHTHWSDRRFELPDTLDFGPLARRIGELMHQEGNDQSLTDFMGYLYELAFLESMSMLPDNGSVHRHLLDESYLLATKTSKREIPDPRIAAQIQLSVLNHLAERLGQSKLSWLATYQGAARRLMKPLSLSQIASRIMLDDPAFKGVDVSEIRHGVRSSAKDLRSQSWLVLVPYPFAPSPTPLEPSFGIYISQPARKSFEWHVRTFRDMFIPSFRMEHQYVESRSASALRAAWPELPAYFRRESLKIPIPIQNAQIDPTQNCNLLCVQCKGDERFVPTHETSIGGSDMIEDASGIHEVNPEASIRISGTIGDPSMNPETVMLMRWLNDNDHPWTEITNGLRVSDEELYEFMGADAIGVSWDTPGNRSYIIAKKHEQDPEAYLKRIVERYRLPHFIDPADFMQVGNLWRPRNLAGLPGDPQHYVFANMEDKWVPAFDATPADLVAYNVRRLVEKRRETGSPVKIFVSTVVLEEYVREVSMLARRAYELGVDGLRIKIKHYHESHSMLRSSLHHLYARTIPNLLERYRNDRHFKIMIDQPEKAAHEKNEGTHLVHIGRRPSPIRTARCYVGDFGAAIDSNRNYRICCQHFSEILDTVGNLAEKSFPELWWGEERRRVLRDDPREKCRECSPNDLNTNNAFDLIRSGFEAFGQPFLTEIEPLMRVIWAQMDLQRAQRRSFRKTMRSAA